ncbi:MAG: hypothetical protein B7Y43_15370 [Sphingomonas sp. 28-62-20]|uniref:DUF1427 family protein n=1 Tax=Sphingomonas sp. 28-62-20 TaxID=1970433 RepID=UPI000BC627DE|nr:MAG: hypothetical protein B7Y43_15370 [Sphingomonas sp. 28-62-20]
MKPYLLSLGAGLLVGALYALLNVRSPAPPVIALLGLLGILIGEQVVSGARGLMGRASASAAAAQPREQPASLAPAPGAK